MERTKVTDKESFSPIRERLRREGKKVVLCHGVFDLLHYGHIEHLQEAKAQGDVLVVSVTAAKYVNKGPGRPYFNDRQRMSFLASLECVECICWRIRQSNERRCGIGCDCFRSIHWENC